MSEFARNFLVQLCRGAGKLATPASVGFASPWLSALEIAAGGAPASKKEGFKDAVTSYVFSRSVKLVTSNSYRKPSGWFLLLSSTRIPRTSDSQCTIIL